MKSHSHNFTLDLDFKFTNDKVRFLKKMLSKQQYMIIYFFILAKMKVCEYNDNVNKYDLNIY